VGGRGLFTGGGKSARRAAACGGRTADAGGADYLPAAASLRGGRRPAAAGRRTRVAAGLLEGGCHGYIPGMDTPPTAPVKAFQFQGCRIMLTYKHHLDKEAYIKWFTTESVGFTPQFIRLAHETGDEHHPYLHTHVLIHFGKNWKCLNCQARLNYRHGDEVVVVNCQPVKTLTHWNNSLRYIAKEDTANADLLTTPKSIADSVWSCATVQDALQRCTKPGDAPGILSLYAHKPRDAPTCVEPDFPWHSVAKDLALGRSDGRSIHWFHDPVGGTGKSWFTRWACLNNHAYAVTTGCSIHHFATIIAGAIDAGWDQRCIIFDLPRQTEDLDRIYTLLEACCDGVVTATKYQGKTVWFNKPVVIVMANWLPNRGRMSLDRWKVYTIQADKTLADNTLAGGGGG